jgi:hypothetical protein
MRQNRFSHEKHGINVGPESSIQLFLRNFGEAVPLVLLSGVVHQYMYAVESFEGSLNGFPAERFIAYIAGYDDAFSAFFLHQPLGILGIGMLVFVG